LTLLVERQERHPESAERNLQQKEEEEERHEVFR